MVVETCLQAARTRDDLPDLINKGQRQRVDGVELEQLIVNSSREDYNRARRRSSESCIHGYLSMFFKASLRAISGVTPPFVAISKAALIEVQNLPICGMFGITTPFSAFS